MKKVFLLNFMHILILMKNHKKNLQKKINIQKLKKVLKKENIDYI